MLKGNPVSLAGQLMDTWKRQAAASAPGRIWSGGLITPIAEHVGIDLEAYDNAPHCQNVDKDLLVQMQMLHVSAGRCYFKLSNSDVFSLPNTPLTTVSDFEHMRNWHMHTRQHLVLCRSMTGRMSAVRLAPRGEEEQEQEQEQEQDQHQQEQQTAGGGTQFEAGPSGTQPKAAQTGGGLTAEQWATLQAFMARQEEHNGRVESRLQSIDALTARVRALEVHVSELTDVGREHLREQRQEAAQQGWSRREQTRFYNYLRSHPQMYYPAAEVR